MAVLNELGKNSAAITYGSVTTGADLWPTFATVDKWLRNDTLQGTATASDVTVTGVGSLFITQLRVNDIIMLAGQKRTVASIISDSSFTVTVAFSPVITLASSIKILNPSTLGTQLLGTVSNTITGYPNTTTGKVSVVTGSATVLGVGTYFLSECTNAVDAVAITGSVAIGTNGTISGTGTAFLTELQPGDSLTINDTAYFTVATVSDDSTATVRVAPGSAITAGATIKKATNGVAGRTISINGRLRVISAIVSNTELTVTPTTPFDFTDSNLQYKLTPRGTISTTINLSAVTGSGTNFYWDLPSGTSQVWVGDELRSFSFTTPTAGSLADPAGVTTSVLGKYPVTLPGLKFKVEDSILTYTPGASSLLNELRVGDDIIINGFETTVIRIISDTLFRVEDDLPLATTATVYKKKKMHGYVFEGTREGTSSLATQSKYSAAGLVYINATSVIGSNTITVNAAGVSHVAGNFVKIQNGGGSPFLLTGTVTATVANTLSGTGTSFTTQLHVGAEVYFGGAYAYIASISSDSAATVTPWSGSITNATSALLYRTTPLYTYITSAVGNVLTLYHPLKNTVVANSTFGPGVQSPALVAGDYIEFVYSALNKSAESTIALVNTSLDRKYFGFRYYPLAGATVTVTGSNAAYNLVVYERWAASWAQSGGVGLNKADCSDRVTALNNVTDQTAMTQQAGGFLYLFAKSRYFLIQGKSFSNNQTQWLGCVEFERVQPEDTGAGSGTATPTGGAVGAGYTYYGAMTAEGYTITPQVSPWPCFAYFNSNRFPVGATQPPTLPVANPNGVHGCVFAVPRIRSSVADLVGLNAHVYSAATITTGRWGHLYEMGAGGAYNSPGVLGTNQITTTIGTIPQPHLGNLVPVNTNIYNSKRFMFSPVVVLGTAWDPDIRGRIYGLKVIPSGLGTLMDTVSVTVEATDDFYSASGTATDHWVITAPGVTTYRWSVFTVTTNATSGYRSLEDNTGTWAVATYPNNFRFAIPS